MTSPRTGRQTKAALTAQITQRQAEKTTLQGRLTAQNQVRAALRSALVEQKKGTKEKQGGLLPAIV